MAFKNVSSLLLLMVSAYCTYYIYHQFDWQNDKQIEPDAEKPLFTSNNIDTTSYDLKGIRNYSLQSKELTYFKSVDETHFTQPLLHTFKAGLEPEWRVSANSAVLKNKNMLIMTGDILIHNLLPNAQLKVITTNQVTLNLTTRDFWTDSETHISGINFTTRGNRAKGNFGSHTAELLEKVETVYESKIN